MRSGSLPWVILVAILALATLIYLEATLANPLFEAIFALPEWGGSDLEYANEGMAMVESIVRNILVVGVLGIGFGVVLAARRAR